MTKKSQIVYSVVSLCAIVAYCGFLVKNSISEVDTLEETLPHKIIDEEIVISLPTEEETYIPVSIEAPTVFSTAEEETLPPPVGFSPIYPITGEITSSFNPKHSYNSRTKDWRTHCGIDISAEKLSPVISCEDGTVISNYLDPLWGHVIELDHGEYVSIYKNLAGPSAFKVGEFVARGEKIGEIGDSIAEPGEYHLHFEMMHYGEYIDPAEFIG